MKLSAEESSENKLGEYSVSSTEWGIELKRGRRLIYVYKPGSRSSNSEMNVRGVILELLAADRDRLAAENAELRAGQQTAYENLVKVAKRAKANAARVRELEAALTAFVEAEDINRQYDGTYDSPPGHVVAEMYERAAAMARAALADSGAAEQEA